MGMERQMMSAALGLHYGHCGGINEISNKYSFGDPKQKSEETEGGLAYDQEGEGGM